MREYVVGYYNWAATKEDFVILATMDSVAAADFVKCSYNEAYKRNGISTEAIMMNRKEVPVKFRWAQ